MANPYGYQFISSKHPSLWMITGTLTVGTTGAVSAVSGNGIQGVTRLTTGVYKVKLVENWNALIKFEWTAYAGITGSNVNDGSFSTGTEYQITALGTTNWANVGLDSQLTPAIGMSFVATGAGGAGTGTAKAITGSNLCAVEVTQLQQAMLQNNNGAQGYGSIFNIRTLDFAGALADPTSGAQLGMVFFLRQSSSVY